MSKQTKKSLFDTEISGELFAAESFEVVNKDKVAADADGVVTITASDAVVDGSQSKAAVYGEGQELVVHGYAGAGSVASAAAIELDLKRDLIGIQGDDRVIQHAINMTVSRVHQSMEAFVHNMNSIHSRGGNQVVFSSINYLGLLGAYAGALLDSRQGTTVFASAFGGAKMRTRIENILSFKSLSWLSLVVFAVLLVAIFYVLLTNAG